VLIARGARSQLAPRNDLHLQVVFRDHAAGPDQVKQFGLAGCRVTGFEQEQQGVEGTRTERGSVAIDEQLPLRRPQPSAPKTELGRSPVHWLPPIAQDGASSPARKRFQNV
jgi:hypothetical protein